MLHGPRLLYPGLAVTAPAALRRSGRSTSPLRSLASPPSSRPLTRGAFGAAPTRSSPGWRSYGLAAYHTRRRCRAARAPSVVAASLAFRRVSRAWIIGKLCRIDAFPKGRARQHRAPRGSFTKLTSVDAQRQLGKRACCVTAALASMSSQRTSRQANRCQRGLSSATTSAADCPAAAFVLKLYQRRPQI